MAVTTETHLARISLTSRYPHYHGRHGRNPSGFLAYVKEQVGIVHAYLTEERQLAVLDPALLDMSTHINDFMGMNGYE